MDPLIVYGTFGADQPLRGQQERSSRNEVDGNDDDDLPFTIHFALVVLGMWKPSLHPELSKNNKGKDGDLGGAELLDITEPTTPKTPKEEEDLSDIDFIALKFEPSMKKKTPRRVRRKILIEVASLIYLSTLTILLMVDGGTYLYNFWGLARELIYMISYITFVLQILFGPLYALLSRLSTLLLGLDATQSCPLDVAYVLRRVRVLRTPKNRHLLKPLFMIIFISWPLGQAILRAITVLVLNHKCHLKYFIFSDITSAWGLVAYGLFWYLMYIERASLHHDLNRVVNNVKRASLTNDVDAACHEIRRVHRDYLVLRELMGVWMALTMVTTSLGLLTQLTWDYAISGQTLEESSEKQSKLYLDITIWSEKIMFIAFPFIALGGINLEYLWQRFSYALERIRSHQHLAFWMAVHIHTSGINRIGCPELKWTAVFALIGLYLSLQARLKIDQNMEFWNGPFPRNCSEG